MLNTLSNSSEMPKAKYFKKGRAWPSSWFPMLVNQIFEGIRTYFPSPCFRAKVPNLQSIERRAMLLPIPI